MNNNAAKEIAEGNVPNTPTKPKAPARARSAVMPPVGEDSAPAYPIGSVDNALRLLRLFGEHKSIRIADASRELGVARSTAHRMMQMLTHHHFVRQDPESRAYVAGEELVRIGLSVVSQIDVRVIARGALEALVAETGETAHLVELRGSDIFFLDSVESPRHVRVGSRMGQSMPAYCASTGKVLLAELESGKVRDLFPRRRLPARTPATKTSIRELEAELALVREQGYATNFGESEEELSAVAVPIRDSLGIARVALAVSAPSSRVTPERTEAWIEALQANASRVSASLHT